MTARFVVGDTRAVTATLPDGSVDFFMCSPPFLALRSYLPADHPDKANEIGSEATPAAFIQVMLELTAEWRRVLAPHGSIVVELGDTYSGSGGAGGDYAEDGLRAGQARFLGSGSKHSIEAPREGTRSRLAAGPNWPMAKSLVGIPERYRLSLIDGVNICTGEPSPAGRWQVRNVIRWVRPNPPVGALGKKWRPATSDLVVATPDDDRRYWDHVATRTELTDPDRLFNGSNPSRINETRDPTGREQGEDFRQNPVGAPLLDWWKIVPKGYEGAHYAVYPPELCVPFIDAMCPRRVCRTCGEPSERVTSVSDSYAEKLGASIFDGDRGREGRRAGQPKGETIQSSEQVTTGWTSCGHPGTDGLRLDGFHDGAGWRPGVVYDPFAGTGTTLAVATGMGRDAIGADLDPRNADLALARVGPLLLTVEHLYPERPVVVSTAPDNGTARNSSGPCPPRFREGYVAIHTALGTTQAPQTKNYGESS